MTGEPGRRRNLWFPDELWAAVVERAAKETVRTGEQISVSEWVRRAVSSSLSEADARTDR